MMEQRFSWTTTMRKGLTTGLSFLAAFTVALQGIEIPEDVSAFEQAAPGVLIAILLAGVRAYNNVRKNGNKPGGPADPFKSLGGTGMFCLAILAALSFTGCATMLPSVAGKTTYSLEFKDITADQDTQFVVKVKAPAGDIVDVIGDMDYQWKADGSGGVKVNQAAGVDSTGQAAMIQEVSAIQAQTMAEILNMLQQLAGPYLTAQTEQAAIRADVDKTEANVTAEQFNAFLERWAAGR